MTQENKKKLFPPLKKRDEPLIEFNIDMPWAETPKEEVWNKNKFIISESEGVLKGPVEIRAIRNEDGSLRFNLEIVVVK